MNGFRGSHVDLVTILASCVLPGLLVKGSINP
jgi:hypothetical protein